MKKNKLLVILVFFFINLTVFAEIPENLLRKSDEAYIPSVCKFNLFIESYENNVKKQYFDMDAFVNGAAQYLILYKNPAQIKGQGQLRYSDTIYSYVKKTDRIQQVSAKTNFFQTVLAQEDVMSSMLSNYYQIETIEEVQEETRLIYRMTLLAKEKRSAYAKIVADIDVTTLLPIRRLFYSYSGQLIKELEVIEIIKNNGHLESVEFRVNDALKNGFYSKVKMTDFDLDFNITESMFTVSYLKNHVK